MEINDIELSAIKVSEFNTRKDLDAGVEDVGLDDLAKSIAEKGLLNPVTVSHNVDGTYGLIVGQRRFLACKKLGWKTIPAIIREVADDTDATTLSLIENVQRADMNPIDKAQAYRQIYDKYRDYNDVARETGVSVSTIKKYVALLSLAPDIQKSITTADGPAGVGTLAKVAETFAPEDQEEVLRQISGFKQQIQLDMVKYSGGDIGKLSGLREKALAGAFDIHICRGIDECNFIPAELLGSIKKMIEEFEDKQ
jgi:ParB family chromosome partitioning protein